MKVTTDSCLFGAWLADYLEENISPVLDIGSGTGLLMLMLAQKFSGDFYGIEKDPQCWEQSVKNAEASPWSERLQIKNGDIRDCQFALQFRLIISNPPFHESQLSGPDQRKNLAHHSESLSFEELIKAVIPLLHPEGMFAVMVPHYRKKEMTDLAADAGLFLVETVQVKQSPKHAYFRTFLIFSGIQKKASQKELCVTGSNGEYTSEFTRLLKPYYLKL